MSGTIRSRTEAQRDRHYLMTTMSHSYPPGESNTCACSKPWPCRERLAADATLADLDNARVVGGASAAYPGAPKPRKRHRLIPDPDSRGAT